VTLDSLFLQSNTQSVEPENPVAVPHGWLDPGFGERSAAEVEGIVLARNRGGEHLHRLGYDRVPIAPCPARRFLKSPRKIEVLSIIDRRRP
jgi:hypothetical protein